MKCNQSRLGFELVSPCPFPTTITITPRAPPCYIAIVETILLCAKQNSSSFKNIINKMFTNHIYICVCVCVCACARVNRIWHLISHNCLYAIKLDQIPPSYFVLCLIIVPVGLSPISAGLSDNVTSFFFCVHTELYSFWASFHFTEP